MVDKKALPAHLAEIESWLKQRNFSPEEIQQTLFEQILILKAES